MRETPSGALLGVHKRFDFVGLIVLAEVTAIGGGAPRRRTRGSSGTSTGVPGAAPGSISSRSSW